MATIKNIAPVKNLPPNYQGSIFTTGTQHQEFSSKISQGALCGKNVITVAWDWIEFTCTLCPETTTFAPTDRFEIEFCEHGTQYFNKLAYINYLLPDSQEWIRCANLELQPKVSFINANIVKIKLENRFCYQSRPDLFIKSILEDLKLTFKNFTRIDVAADFQKTSLDETPQVTFKKFSDKKYKVRSKTMEVFHRANDITGIKFGRRTSGCSITMYNKSLDMRKKGLKRHIQELWDDANFNRDCEVYRLEFSEKKNLETLMDSDLEEILCNHSDLSYISDVKRNFKFMYKKHFQTAISTGKEKEQFTRLEKFNMLDVESTAIVSERLCEKKQSNNYVKAHIKRSFEDAMKYEMAGQALKAGQLYEYIQDQLTQYDLFEWFNKKFPMYRIFDGQMTVHDYIVNETYLKTNLKQAMLLN